MAIKIKNMGRSGMALLAILFVIAIAAVLAIGFLAQSEAALSSGRNMALRAETEYLAGSGLEHARGLIINPQDVSTEYWTGATRQQLVSGSDRYYDVSISRVGYLDYTITSEGYKETSGQKVGRSGYTAKLRLNPCIAMRVGSSYASEACTTVYGDMYSGGDLKGVANIYGDVFAAGVIQNANIQGQKNASATSPIGTVGISATDFYPTYRIGSNTYTAGWLVGDLNNVTLGPTASNPKGIYYRLANLDIYKNVTINGMLIVVGDLKFKMGNNIIRGQKNFPAIIATNKLRLENVGTLTVEGLVLVGDRLEFGGLVNANLTVFGCLYIRDNNVDGMSVGKSTLRVLAWPDRAAIEVYTSAGALRRWSPATGAFFKSIASF